MNRELLESELFGHEKGAFTGAVGAKTGLVTAACGGTLFLDELAEMPGSMQVSLLRFLDQGEYDRLGARARFMRTFASSEPPIRIFRHSSHKAAFARTCSTASTP